MTTRPPTGQGLASRLAAMFAEDSEIAKRLNDAQSRLQHTNAQLWSGLHSGALALLYDNTDAVGIAADGRTRSRLVAVMIDQLRAGADEQQLETAVLAVLQEIHWTIHRAFVDHQSAARNADSSQSTSARSPNGSRPRSPRRDGLAPPHATRTSTTSPKGDSAMPPIDNDPVEEIFARARDRSERFKLWMGQLRSGDPAFADASALYPDDMGEWQAATYLLTGCETVWAATKPHVIAKGSIGPVTDELQRPRQAWSSSEDAVMQWAAHFWDVDRWPVTLPYAFEELYFRRWITASHLYKKIPPALTTTHRDQR